MSNTVKCTFNTLTERDMDMLLLEAVVTDHDFAQMLVDKAGIKWNNFNVVSAELSKSDSELGESDITVIIEIDGKKHGFLIEDKIDAIAMHEQHDRYVKRGELGVRNKDYEDFTVFIFCPNVYYNSNDEAKKYEHHLLYEECKAYFDSRTDAANAIRSQKIAQAIHKSKSVSVTKVDQRANAFLRNFIAYQREHYPSLDISSRENSNGWWIEYRTSLKYVWITQKNERGYIDLTFPKSAGKLPDLKWFAGWARSHGLSEITAVKTGTSSSLRLPIPEIDCTKEFEATSKDDIEKCLKAALELTELAEAIRIAIKVISNAE